MLNFSQQLQIFDQEILEPEGVSRMTIDDAFKAFHRLNPHIFLELRDRALRLLRVGHKTYGIKCIIEAVRYDYTIRTRGSEFKINNNYTSRYARLLMDEVPELDGFFRTRELKTA